ncbi:MAG: hypothetical protein AAF702_15875 [Chloroflexota bacterium]
MNKQEMHNEQETVQAQAQNKNNRTKSEQNDTPGLKAKSNVHAGQPSLDETFGA